MLVAVPVYGTFFSRLHVGDEINDAIVRKAWFARPAPGCKERAKEYVAPVVKADQAGEPAPVVFEIRKYDSLPGQK